MAIKSDHIGRRTKVRAGLAPSRQGRERKPPEAISNALLRNLPREMFPKRPIRFLVKFWFAIAVIASCYVTIALGFGWLASVAAAIVAGLMYAHLVELQHECLHGHAFNSRRCNRLYGLGCGWFMLSSYSYYQYEHLRHHASLGKPGNREFFNYRLRRLNSPLGFARAALSPRRYGEVARDIAASFTGRPIVGIHHRHDASKIAWEYRALAGWLAAVAILTVLTGDPLFIFAWLLPVLVVSGPVHFLIELPEHFALNTQDEPDVLANTRTIRASALAEWYTNFNNFHAAHHYHQGVPMGNVRELHRLIEDRYLVVESSYWSFFRKVIGGELKYADPARDMNLAMSRSTRS